MHSVLEKPVKHKHKAPPLDLYTPRNERERRIDAEFAAVGYVIAFAFLRRPDGRYRLNGTRRMIVPGAGGER